MNNSLAITIEELERSKADFIQLLETFSKEQHAFKPADSWNMLQVVEHVISSEKGTLEYLKRKTLAPFNEIELASAEDKLNGEKLNSALISDKQWKAPGVLTDPSGTQSLANMLIYWNDVRTDYSVFLENLDENYHSRLIFKHPIVGRIDLFQTLEFLSNHILHHTHQINRIVKEVA